MIIKYEFLSTLEGEVLEVEVDDSLGKAIAEMNDAEEKTTATKHAVMFICRGSIQTVVICPRIAICWKTFWSRNCMGNLWER